jgi:hypothetical protein
MYKTWDPIVLEVFLQYGLRELPTAMYPDPTDSGSAPVTLTTTKHQEVASYTRPAFPPDRSTPLADFQPTRVSHPDMGDKNWRNPKDPFYRAESTMLFAQLQYLRPSCLWLYGEKTIFVPFLLAPSMCSSTVPLYTDGEAIDGSENVRAPRGTDCGASSA